MLQYLKFISTVEKTLFKSVSYSSKTTIIHGSSTSSWGRNTKCNPRKWHYRKKDYLKSFDLNFFPIIEIVKKYKENLKKNKSSIVVFSTIAVKQGFPNHSIISPVKASLEGLTVSLAAELAPNVRINCIAPSLSNSKMAGRILGNAKIAEGIAKQHPLKRIGEGMDSAALAKFLLSEESSWITGQIIGVDGGRSNVG